LRQRDRTTRLDGPQGSQLYSQVARGPRFEAVVRPMIYMPPGFGCPCAVG
jgi:hypothetical protein